jgi:hypothetical protein
MNASVCEQQPRRAVAFYNVRLSDREAWFGATIAVLFNAVGMLIELAIVRRIPGVSAEPAAVSAFVGVVLMVVLLIQRKTPSVKWATIIYSLNTASVVTALLSTNLQFAVSERNWSPFEASKLGCLIAAMVAPGFWVGFLSILAFSIGPLLQFELSFPAEIRGRIAEEPWPVLAFALGGVLALVYRFRRARLEQELVRIQAQNLAIKQLANAFLNIRDLMNTPLQVIEFSVDVLRKSNKSAKPTIDRIDRSVQDLREINSVLVQHEKEIDWQSRR